MRSLIILFITFISFSSFSQKNTYNLKKGAIASGYDVVSYFSNEAKKGNDNYIANYDGAMFYFSSKENLNLFKKTPSKYIPQYGGYCAYAIGLKGKKVSINPKTFEIRDGKLYLFYNSWGTNTLNLWKKEGPENLKIKADKNWVKIKNN